MNFIFFGSDLMKAVCWQEGSVHFRRQGCGPQSWTVVFRVVAFAVNTQIVTICYNLYSIINDHLLMLYKVSRLMH